MYLAPLNYDRFFQRVFSDPRIAKLFLEALLGVKIERIELIQRKNKITDDAAFMEFDFRCKIDGQYVIIEMQQAYKSDVVKRFYLYFCTNTSLQSENIPTKIVPSGIDTSLQSENIPTKIVSSDMEKSYKTKDYNLLEPSITIIWMANDPLGFTDDIVAYSLFPEMANDFIRNEALWTLENLPKLLESRQELLKKMDNNAKGLGFLSENRLIYAFQSNIVKNKALMTPYYEWFDFAEKTRNKDNKESDFSSFKNKPVFMEVIEKLKTTTFEEDDWVYLEKNEEYYEGVARYQAGVWREAREETMREARIEARIEAKREARIEVEAFIEAAKKQAEQEKVKAEQDAQKFELALVAQQMLTVRKCLKRGDSLEAIMDFMEIDMSTLTHLLEQIKAEDAAKNAL